ncbi:post-initiation translation factor DPC29 Ecym_7274 [Eremothecium cymbalariae DBVPG|uniref:Transcriptional regulatory protein n=1 Tax=Eremothecium cymbalariae (strain CBS 270.75 / DBVPG 7215 / KCTC 17166 / NRRL Y-17582) TaxID=931890 RepID=G8JWA1_ERECY|nr:hypothetical protein Ecym_7274 [Eremothecium cymbalariae DBVPG\
MVFRFRVRALENVRHTNRCMHTTVVAKSGHSKWSTIKHDKAKNDSLKNNLFNKYANRIAVAVKVGGSADPRINIRLATAIEEANKANVTKKVIENAIKKGSGVPGSKNNAETYTYEGVGPGGVAFVIEALTDNRNRTVSNVRGTFNKHNGNLTSTLYFFMRKGFVGVRPPNTYENFDAVLERVAEIEGVDDLEVCNQNSAESIERTPSELYEVITEPTTTNQVASSLKEQGFDIVNIGIRYIPKSDMIVQITDPVVREEHEKLVSQLNDIDDITDVYTNLRH